MRGDSTSASTDGTLICARTSSKARGVGQPPRVTWTRTREPGLPRSFSSQ